MLDIGWSELLVIGIVALIVVGPRDLPVLFRRMGQFMGKARAMAREFTSAMNAAADEAGVKDMANDLRKVANPRQMGLDAINKSAEDLTRWDDDEPPAKPKLKPKPASGTAANGAGASPGTPDRGPAVQGNGADPGSGGQASAAATASTDPRETAKPAEPADNGSR